MKNFLKNVLASTIGTFIAVFLSLLFIFIIGLGLAATFSDAMNSQGGTISESGILEITLEEQIPDLSNNVEANLFSFDELMGLQDIKKLIVAAASDNKIKGIMLNPKSSGVSFSSLSEIRNALSEYKNLTDKPIYAYSDYYSQSQYYLASIADSVFLNPNGIVDFNGLGIQMPFFKDMLEKLGVDVEVYYVGDFKSATEPFRRNSMSEQDKIQKRQFLESMNEILISDVAQARNLSYNQVDDISTNMKIRDAEDAISFNFVDKLGYYSDFINTFKSALNIDLDEKVQLIPLQTYFKNKKASLLSSDYDSPIAIVYAEGNIVDDGNDLGTISDDKYIRILRKIGYNDEIEAVVLRVNSGGGSALASDNIWHEIENLKAKGVKVVVSMGNYAASGGYYIACNADKIYAEPSTITGSIGVFGMMFNPQELLNNKLGIHFDTIQTGRFTNSFSPLVERNQEEKAIIQNSVEDIYEQFTQRVAEGRNMPIDRVKEIAQGRVYTGKRAVEIGLVDELGSLEDAIEHAKLLIGREGDIKTRSYPKIENPIEVFLNELSEGKAPQKVMVKQFPAEIQRTISEVENLKNMNGIQAKLMLDIIVE